jgi:hypothetical protein
MTPGLKRGSDCGCSEVCSAFTCAIGEMGRPRRRRYVGVTKERPDDWKRQAARPANTCVRVTKIVEAHVRYSGSVSHAIPQTGGIRMMLPVA